MSGGEATTFEPAALQGLRIGIAQGLPLRGLDEVEVVASRLFEAVNELGRVGVQLSPELFPQFDDRVRANARGSIAVAEAYAIHRERLATRGAEFDPFVRSRVERGREISAADQQGFGPARKSARSAASIAFGTAGRPRNRKPATRRKKAEW
jgi:aspartyl-tRNA(Asn)/glutamyl-tRNA(Gln) amidotransferase subunit A